MQNDAYWDQNMVGLLCDQNEVEFKSTVNKINKGTKQLTLFKMVLIALYPYYPQSETHHLAFSFFHPYYRFNIGQVS